MVKLICVVCCDKENKEAQCLGLTLHWTYCDNQHRDGITTEEESLAAA